MEELKEGWRRVKLGEVAEILNGYAFKANDFKEIGVPVIKIKNITPPKVKLEDVQFVSEELYNEKIKYSLIYNDILISMTGSHASQPNSVVGRVARIKEINRKALLNQRVGKIYPKNEECNQSFLYYYLSQDFIKFELAASAGGSASQANINHNQIKELEISFPPLETQEKIASILSALDDKIEINNEMNKTLEEMAQTLFKRWFIDFDFPNENGEPYRSSGGKMVDSELGEIPEGWEVEELGKISTLSAGGDKPQSFSKIQTSDYTIPIYSNGVENEGLYGFTNEAKIFEKGITVSARGTIGYICLRQVPYVPIVRLVSIVPNINILSSEYLYYYLKKVEIHSTGTTQQQLTVPQFKRTKILIPNFEVLKIFTGKVESMINLLEKNKSENKSISLIRDTLLPKLMSGEIEA